MRVLLVGDMTLLWEGIAQTLSTRGISQSVTRLPSIADAVRYISRSDPDVALVQSCLSDGGVSEAVRLLRSASDNMRVIVLGLGYQNDEAFLAALEEGASGFIDGMASLDDLLDCVRRVGEGDTVIPHHLAVRLAHEYRERPPQTPQGPGLTGRELEVLQLLAQGYSNKAMAQQLVLSEHTVRAHLRNIMHKLGADNRVQAVARASRDGFLVEHGTSLTDPYDKALTA
jgi:DNA-binding NarL/FixJ family response regulator